MMDHPLAIWVCTHCLFCGKNLARASNQATDLAEWANVYASGRDLPLEDDATDRRQLKI